MWGFVWYWPYSTHFITDLALAIGYVKSVCHHSCRRSFETKAYWIPGFMVEKIVYMFTISLLLNMEWSKEVKKTGTKLNIINKKMQNVKFKLFTATQSEGKLQPQWRILQDILNDFFCYRDLSEYIGVTATVGRNLWKLRNQFWQFFWTKKNGLNTRIAIFDN